MVAYIFGLDRSQCTSTSLPIAVHLGNVSHFSGDIEIFCFGNILFETTIGVINDESLYFFSIYFVKHFVLDMLLYHILIIIN